MKTIYQFGFRNGPPKEEWGPVFDCRSLPNPFKRGVPDVQLRALVAANPRFPGIVQEAVSTLGQPGVQSIAIGCLFGKHRSGAVADAVAKLIGARIVRMS